MIGYGKTCRLHSFAVIPLPNPFRGSVFRFGLALARFDGVPRLRTCGESWHPTAQHRSQRVRSVEWALGGRPPPHVGGYGSAASTPTRSAVSPLACAVATATSSRLRSFPPRRHRGRRSRGGAGARNPHHAGKARGTLHRVPFRRHEKPVNSQAQPRPDDRGPRREKHPPTPRQTPVRAARAGLLAGLSLVATH